MNSYSKSDNPERELKFRKRLKWDAFWLALIFLGSFLAVFLMPLIAYLGQKYDF